MRDLLQPRGVSGQSRRTHGGHELGQFRLEQNGQLAGKLFVAASGRNQLLRDGTA